MTPLRIAVDARLWAQTGIGRYVCELCRHLLLVDDGLHLLLMGAPASAAVADRAEVVDFSARPYSLKELLCGGRMAGRYAGRVGLYHYPHYNVPVFSPLPFVMTVQDLIHFKFPGMFSGLKVGVARKVLRRAARRAARIMTPSESTRNDLVDMLPWSAEKIDVVPYAASGCFHAGSPEKVEHMKSQRGLDRYILGMCARKPYKNEGAVIEAFRILSGRHRNLQLVLVGPVATARQPGICYAGHVSDEELRLLYCGAECFVFPTLYEGFGLPVLEAMACGCPVVCSTGSSLDEVAGGAALQRPGRDIEGIAQALEGVLESAELREDLVGRGLARAASFSWHETARRALQVYERACRSG